MSASERQAELTILRDNLVGRHLSKPIRIPGEYLESGTFSYSNQEGNLLKWITEMNSYHKCLRVTLTGIPINPILNEVGVILNWGNSYQEAFFNQYRTSKSGKRIDFQSLTIAYNPDEYPGTQQRIKIEEVGTFQEIKETMTKLKEGQLTQNLTPAQLANLRRLAIELTPEEIDKLISSLKST